MTVVLKFEGEFAPVSFRVAKTSLFGISFLVEGQKSVLQLDRMISRHACFSLTPEIGISKFIGRILKIRIMQEEPMQVIYAFMVDEVRVPKKTRKVD